MLSLPPSLVGFTVDFLPLLCKSSWVWKNVYMFPLARVGATLQRTKCPGVAYLVGGKALHACPCVKAALDKLQEK